MGIVVVPINDSSAANATDIPADDNSTPIDLAISAVGVDPLVKAEPLRMLCELLRRPFRRGRRNSNCQ